MRIPRAFLVAGFLAFLAPAAAQAKIKVVASTNDLASIAASVGGDLIDVSAIARPQSDVHRVEVLPSYMVRVARAELYLKVGLGLDPWADGIIAGSRNRRVTIVDCSRGVDVLEKPTGKISAALGDVHPDGNPHYWLDPRNGGVVAGNVAEALGRIDPAHAAGYRARADTFAKECAAAHAQGLEAAGRLPAKVALTYHRSWSYFAHAFGLEIVNTVEPVPGIPPTARHLAELVKVVQSRHVLFLIQEPYFSNDAGKFLARQSGIHVVVAAPSCDGPQAGSYLAHIADILRLLGSAS